MARTIANIFGKGIAFPFQIDPRTGGVLMSQASTEAPTVLLQYLPDGYTVENAPYQTTNHIAESLAHIIQTIPGEHDTLPKFGSNVPTMINDPNNEFIQMEFEVWLELGTARWEKRVRIPVPSGVNWLTDDNDRDRNISKVQLLAQFIQNQRPDNLVSPFVTPRQAREKEYPLGTPDTMGHDWASRYYNGAAITYNGMRMVKPRKPLRITPAADDIWYETKHFDTWLLISDRVYDDIRFDWVIQDCYVQDMAAAGEPRSNIDLTGDPPYGLLLRMPSKTRLLMQIAA